MSLHAGIPEVKAIIFRKTSTRKRWIQCCQEGLRRASKRNTKPECLKIILTEQTIDVIEMFITKQEVFRMDF